MGLLIVGETALLSYKQLAFGYRGSPVILLLLGILIGLLPILYFYLRRKKLAKEDLASAPRFLIYLRYLLVSFVFLYGVWFTQNWITGVWDAYPGYYSQSDIIPSLKQIYVDRFLGKGDGNKVYDMYPGFGYQLSPTYMPFQWMPFLIAEALNIDYRYIPLALGMIGLLLLCFRLARSRIPLLLCLAIGVLPFWALFKVAEVRPQSFYLAIELLDVGYYLILAWAILQRNWVWRGLGLLLCLLSRYALVLWVPFYLLGGLWREYIRQGQTSLFSFLPQSRFFKIGLIVLFGMLAIYVIPFLSQDWGSYSRGQKAYVVAAVGAWTLAEGEKDLPYAMTHGTGMAIWFYKHGGGDLEAKVHRIRRWQLVCSILAALLVGLGYVLAKDRIPLGPYFLFGLKIYLSVFYALIQVPYPYLFLVPMGVSWFVWLAASGYMTSVWQRIDSS